MPVSHCPNCGYDTAGLREPVCPECGKQIPDTAPPGAPRLHWRVLLALATVGATVALGYAETVLPGVPRWWGPLPLSVVIPYFMTGTPVLALTPLAVVATLLSVPALAGARRVTWWSVAPVALIGALAWYWFAGGVHYGLEYEGRAYVVVCGAIQGAFTVALFVLWAISRRKRSFWLAATWHVIVSLWLASYAFPYLGELP